MPPQHRELKVLSLIDSEADFLRINHYLEYLGLPIRPEHVSSLEDLKTKIQLEEWNLVIYMTKVSGINPLQVLLEIKNLNQELPFILISNGLGEEEVADLIKAGAEDVVLTSRLYRLIQAVRRVLRDSDVREKERMVKKIAHDAYAAKKQMLTVVSHDIKNPLSAIQLEAQMLIKLCEKNKRNLFSNEVQTQATRILKMTNRLRSIITDLLDRNKCTEGLSKLVKEDSDIVKIFQDVLDSHRFLVIEKGISLIPNFPDYCKVSIDRNKIFQVISNLISNAIKFTPRGGVINLEIIDEGIEVIVSVKDNGFGLKNEDANKIFDKYWTRGTSDNSGNGLGLYICKTIIEAHQGVIQFENISSGGCRFWFSIPKLNGSLLIETETEKFQNILF